MDAYEWNDPAHTSETLAAEVLRLAKENRELKVRESRKSTVLQDRLDGLLCPDHRDKPVASECVLCALESENGKAMRGQDRIVALEGENREIEARAAGLIDRQAVALERLDAVVAGVREALDMSERIDVALIPQAVATIKGKLAALKKENQTLKAEVASVRQEMNSRRMGAQSAFLGDRARIADLEAERATLEAEVKRRQADFRDMTALAGIRERERDEARVEVERLKGKSTSAVEALNEAIEAYPFASALLRAAADMIRERHPQPPASE